MSNCDNSVENVYAHLQKISTAKFNYKNVTTRLEKNIKELTDELGLMLSSYFCLVDVVSKVGDDYIVLYVKELDKDSCKFLLSFDFEWIIEPYTDNRMAIKIFLE